MKTHEFSEYFELFRAYNRAFWEKKKTKKHEFFDNFEFFRAYNKAFLQKLNPKNMNFLKIWGCFVLTIQLF